MLFHIEEEIERYSLNIRSPIYVYLIIERNYFLRGRSRFNGRKFYITYQLYYNYNNTFGN